MDSEAQENLLNLCEKIYEDMKVIHNFMDVIMDYLEEHHDLRMCRKCATKMASHEYDDGYKLYYCHNCQYGL